MDRRLVGLALVVASAWGFGSGALFAKPIYGAGVDWLVLSVWRFVVGAILAWAWLLASPTRRAGFVRLVRSGSRRLLVTVLLGVLFTANSATYFAGLVTVPASLAALIVYIYPAIVAVLSLRIGARLRGRVAWSGLLVALLGVGLAVGGIDAVGAPPIEGLALIVASPIIYAVWIVLAARLSGERRGSTAEAAAQAEELALAEGSRGLGTEAAPRETAGAETAAATAVMTTATALTYLVLVVASGRPFLPEAIPSAAWPPLLGVGAIATFVAITAFYEGARRVGAATAALVSTVEPIWTISLAALLLGESLGPIQLLGGVLILAGVAMSQSASLRGRRQAWRDRRAAGASASAPDGA